jgi:hypothetical protein
MPRTLAEVQADLTTVNSALQELISGNRLTQLRIGSGDFARFYQYQEITFENLTLVKNELLQELAILNSEPAITFRKMCNIPLTVVKFRN